MALGKKKNPVRQRSAPVVHPYPHASGAVPPAIPAEFIPRHVAIVMDGNGRWANQRGLPRIEGHKAGEPALLDVLASYNEAPYVSLWLDTLYGQNVGNALNTGVVNLLAGQGDSAAIVQGVVDAAAKE